MKTKRKNLTEDQKMRRRAKKKAEALNAEAVADVGPLYADQVELTTPDEQYWKSRHAKAMIPAGKEAGYLAGVERRIDLWVIRNIARRYMRPEDFEIADKKDWVGDVLKFWRDVLTGARRLVLSWERISHGWNSVYLPPNEFRKEDHMIYVEKVEMREGLVWPPPGWAPPLTSDELVSLTHIPPAYDFPDAIDPLNLGNQKSLTMARMLT